MKVMSTDAVTNVVPLRAPDRTGPSNAAQFERLLTECRDLACQRLSQSLAGMLDKADDTLWGLSNATQEREAQKLYGEAKDKLLPRRKDVEERFRSRYLAEFDNRAGPGSKAGGSFSDYSGGGLELGLVEEDDLNETLKVKDMAARLRRYCDEELVALDQRMGVLLGDANLQADASPFSPQAICDAFKLTCRDIESDVKVRMVFVKLFDDHVLDDVRSIYKAVNALLVQNSILPKIRYSMSRNRDGDAAPAAAGAAMGGKLGPAATGAAVPAGEQDVFSVLQNLIAMNAGAMGAGVASPAGSAGSPADGPIQIPGFPPIFGVPGEAMGAVPALLQGAALLGSLTRIQHGDHRPAEGMPALSVPGSEAGRTNVLRELKGTSVVAGMGQMDVATLDIVAMLFDQIFEDREIPDGMKWLIGRLQIPMLKVAILDKAFFSTRTHPARQLLDTLGEIALGLPADFGSSSPLYQRVETIVQKLIDGFQDSLEIFDALRQELQDLAAEDNQRLQEQTRGTAKRMEQKERLAVAKAVAQDEVKARIRAGNIPKVVLRFLAQQWLKLLLLTHAKRGKDAEAWTTALEIMDQLIWSVGPKPTLEDRRKLAALLPGLLKRLASGMRIVGTSEAVRTRFFTDLLKLHTEAMGGAVPRSLPAAEAAASHDSANSQPAGASGVTPPAVAPQSADASPEPSGPAESEPQGGDEGASLDFTTVTIKNPFGDGEVEVDEVELPSLPGAPAVAVKDGDEYSRLASTLKEGTWLEFRNEKERHQVKLSYVSPFKSAYLFVNRQGQTVGEYALYELAAEMRAGRAVVIDEVPMFDRAMTGLMGALRGGTTPH
jgi:Protein of unknown function (DUF1631)